MTKKRYQIFLYENQAEKIEKLVDEDYFDNASEAMRAILRISLDRAYDQITNPAGIESKKPKGELPSRYKRD